MCNNKGQSVKQQRWLIFILVVAFLLRLGYVLAQDYSVVHQSTGGDSGWYLIYGRLLVVNAEPGPPPSAPFYLLLLGWLQFLLPPEAAIAVLRMIQSLAGTATCYFAYGIGWMLTTDRRAGLLAAGVLAISPVFVLETAQVTTETLYIFFVTGGLLAYLELVQHREWSARQVTLRIVMIGLLFGLATATRAVSLLFPVGLGGYWLWMRGWRAGLKQVGVMLLTYLLVISVWTVYNLVKWDRFVVGAEGFSAFLYIGAREEGWTSPYDVDESLLNGAEPARIPDSRFVEGAAQTISGDPMGYIGRRINDVLGAYLQPHGTTQFPGDSLKEMAAHWLQEDRTPGGLVALTQGDYFWPKLVLYIFHYVGLLAGAVGMWLCRNQWRLALPLIGFILYTTLIHFFLDAIPRYIFPTTVCWWIFAAVTLVALGDKIRTVSLPGLQKVQAVPTEEQKA